MEGEWGGERRRSVDSECLPIVSYYVCIAGVLSWIQVEQKNGIANSVCVCVCVCYCVYCTTCFLL